MVNEKDLKPTGQQFKKEPNIPKTETKIILEQQDLYPDLGYEDVSSSKGYGPCTSCRCNNTFTPFSVEIINSSGRGWNGGGHCAVCLSSENEAKTFCLQVRNGWISHEGIWTSSGTGWITPGKREKLAQAVESRLNNSKGGNIWDSEMKD